MEEHCSDKVFSCDCCGEETDHPVSIHAPIGGGNKSPLDFCPECATQEMQKMADRLGHEHGSKLVMEVKTRQAKRGPAGISAKARTSGTAGEEDEEAD